MTPRLWPKDAGLRRTAFTLIELLVVIAIIAILAALLSPAVAGARNRGKMTACISNMHQLGIALQMYANDWGTRVPRSSQDITVPGLATYPGARWTIHLQYRNYLLGNTAATYWQFPANARNSILLCPSDPPSQWVSPITSDPPLMQEYGGSYLYNSETIAVDGILPQTDSSKKILLIDGPPKDPGGMEYTFDQSNFAARMKPAGFPTNVRHFGKSNALFLDWHVENIDPSLVVTNNVSLN